MGAKAAQATALAVSSNGTTEDVTARALWTSSDQSILAVTSAGWVQAVAIGEAALSVQYAGHTGWTTVRVNRALFKTRGRIVEQHGGVPIAGAAITVTSGPDRGTTATTDATGGFVLRHEAEAPFDFTAMASDFETRTLRAMTRDVRPRGRKAGWGRILRHESLDPTGN